MNNSRYRIERIIPAKQARRIKTLNQELDELSDWLAMDLGDEWWEWVWHHMALAGINKRDMEIKAMMRWTLG